MFAGKSSTALRLIHRNAVIGRKTFCITSAFDTRYKDGGGVISSHTKESSPAMAVTTLYPLLLEPEFQTASCVIIEEAQFFPDLLDFVLSAVEANRKDVVCIGLDGDSERQPFGQLLNLIPYANSVTKLTALCTRCNDGTAAPFTFRKRAEAGDPQIHVGGTDAYEALCRTHYLEGQYENHIVEIHTHIQQNPDITALELLDVCIRRYGLQDGTDFFNRHVTPRPREEQS